MGWKRVLKCLVEGVLTGLLIGFIDSLSKEAKAGIRNAQKRYAKRAVPFNRFDLNMN